MSLSHHAQAPQRQGSRAPVVLLLVVALVLFAGGVAWNIGLPGLYMDAVNPDYLAVRMLHPQPWRLPAWMMPGNMLADRWPVLTSLYHGSLHAWTLVPGLALFGPSLPLLRISHALWGAGILLMLFVCLRRAGAGKSLALGLVALLALDPAFIFAFRTQLYITLAPTLFVLMALCVAQRTALAQTYGGRFGGGLLTGVLAGMAVYGYFIYAFFIPGLVLWMGWLQGRAVSVSRTRATGLLLVLLGLGLGLALGAAGYWLGYGLMWVETGGWAGLLDYLRSTTGALKAFESHPSQAQVLKTFALAVRDVINAQWQAKLMLGTTQPYPAQHFKLAWMLGLSAFGAVYLLLRRQLPPWPLAVLLLLLSFAAGALYFGDRLSGHHFAPLIVLAYLGTGAVLAALLPRWRVLRAPLLLAMMLTALISLWGQWTLQQRLVATGGKQLYSDAIDRFTAHAQQTRPQALYVLPDWGLFMPFQYLSGGQLDHVVTLDRKVVRALCANREVVLSLMGADAEHRLPAMLEPLGLRATPLEPFFDREQQRVITSSALTPFDESRCVALREAAQHARRGNEQAQDLGITWQPTRLQGCRPQVLSLQWRLSKLLTRGEGINQVQVLVKQPDEQVFRLFSLGGLSGSVQTGQWVQVGSQFRFADAATGELLATITLDAADEVC